MKVFDPFRLDTTNLCLWREEERVSLTPKAFDVLRHLVEHAGRLVTPDEILSALWPETYVNPEGIRKYILEIRKALRDDPERPAFIETVPKRGYKFVAAVTSGELPVARWATTSGAEEKFVGRSGSLTECGRHLETALSGQRQIVFITGEAGVGKTTLVDVFQQRASATRHLQIARGQCIEGFGGTEAYYPMLEAVGSLARGVDGASWVSVMAARAPTWLIQFPSLVKAEERDSLRRDILGSTRERMVREICEAFETVTAEKPLLLILEDLHWADPSTLDLISALARRRQPAKLLLLATYRPVDVVLSRSPLKPLKHDLVVRRLGHEVAVERLQESDVAEYLTRSFGAGSLPHGLAKLVHGNSGGNPLFMTAIVQDMANKGLIREEQGELTLSAPLDKVDPGIPETLQEMLEIQLERLSEEHRRILQGGSVAGERFSVWAIAAMFDASQASIEEECDRLESGQQFIRRNGMLPGPDGAPSAHYEFKHALYRQAIYRNLSGLQRSQLHRSLGDRLLPLCREGRPELASEVALHLEEGRDHQGAANCWALSAENAVKRFSRRESIRILRHALELVSGSSPELEIQILQRIGDAQYALGEMSDSIVSYERAAERAVVAGLKEARLLALGRLATPAWYVDQARGGEVSRRALELCDTLPDTLLAAQTRLTTASLRLLYDSWREEDASVCAHARETIRRLSGSGAVHDAFYIYVLWAEGKYAEVLQHVEDLIASAVDPTAHVLAVGAKILVLISCGRFGEALKIIRAGKESAEKDAADPWMYNFREAWLRTLCFDFEGVRALSSVSMRSNPKEHATQPRAISMINSGYVELYQGNFGEAMRCFEQVLDEGVTPPFFLHWQWRVHARLGITEALLCAGNPGAAHHEADVLLERAHSLPNPNIRALAWEMKARVAKAEGDSRAAREFIGNALESVQRFEIPVVAWRVYGAAWELEAGERDHTSAEQHRARAKELILRIADSFDRTEPLRQSLLSGPPVRRIFDQGAFA